MHCLYVIDRYAKIRCGLKKPFCQEGRLTNCGSEDAAYANRCRAGAARETHPTRANQFDVLTIATNRKTERTPRSRRGEKPKIVVRAGVKMHYRTSGGFWRRGIADGTPGQNSMLRVRLRWPRYLVFVSGTASNSRVHGRWKSGARPFGIHAAATPQAWSQAEKALQGCCLRSVHQTRRSSRPTAAWQRVESFWPCVRLPAAAHSATEQTRV